MAFGDRKSFHTVCLQKDFSVFKNNINSGFKFCVNIKYVLTFSFIASVPTVNCLISLCTNYVVWVFSAVNFVGSEDSC